MNLESKLVGIQLDIIEQELKNFFPEDSKYSKKVKKLRDTLTPEAEWFACAFVQYQLIKTREEYGQATKKNVNEVENALLSIKPARMSYIEDNITRHDQLAVIEELGLHVSPETKALLHPGTTSYDILDTARSYLYKKAWNEVIRPELIKTIHQLFEKAENYQDVLQVGRTHLQHTSPILLGSFFGNYAGRLTDRLKKCDTAFNDLRGKISGMVGNGAGIEMVIGENALEFEKDVLRKLGLEPDNTAFQVVQKERLSDVGHSVTSLARVLGNLADDIRILYGSDIKELGSGASEERLGGSSADAAKDNPILWENVAGKGDIIEGYMRVFYEMITTNLQRDLKNSVQARYAPLPLVMVYESLVRTNSSRGLKGLGVHFDNLEANLQKVRDFPSEAMTAILRGEAWIHPELGVGHDFVKKMSVLAKHEKKPLLEVCLEDEDFQKVFENLTNEKQTILKGGLELYTGFAKEKLFKNIEEFNQYIKE